MSDIIVNVNNSTDINLSVVDAPSINVTLAEEPIISVVSVGQQGLPGAQGVDGAPGADGDSAYQVWLDEGNVGTEQDFLDSLVGPTGPAGTTNYNDLTNKPFIPAALADLSSDATHRVVTDTQISKLDGVASGAEVNVNADWNAVTGDAEILNKPVIPDQLSDLTDDSTHRLVTDVEKGVWNGKQDALGFTAVPNTRTVNGHALSADVTVTKSDVGLANAENTSDLDKPISTVTQSALDLKEPSFGKNTAFNKNFGVVGGSVCEGNDARLSDARTPLAHKATHKVGGSDSLFPIDRIQFDTAAGTPAYVEGQMFWDNTDKCISIQTSPDTTLCIGQEGVIRVRNISGSTITNGTPIYISGVSSGTPTIAVAMASSTAATKTIAVATQNIANNAFGFVTTFGLVHDINTSTLVVGELVWLGVSGGLTSTRPSYPNTAVQLGTCMSVDGVTGHIHVNVSPETFQKGFDVMKQPLGVVDRTQSTMTYTEGTRQFSITPTGSYWSFFNKGLENRVSTVQTLTHTNTTGGHFFYVDTNNVFTYSTSPWDLITDVPLMYVYFNATTGKGIALEERHGATRNPEWHRSAHINIGTYYVSGLAASGYTLSGTTDAQNQYGIDTGIIRDEDLSISLTAQADGGTYNILQRIGVTGDWQVTTSSVPLLYAAASYVQYNQNTGATWQMTAASGGDFVNYYVVATTGLDATKQLYIVPAQTLYATLNLAKAANFNNDINWGTLPFTEFCVVHKFTYRTGASYTQLGKCRTEDYVDLRGTTNRVQVSAGATTSTHNGLAGLNTGDYIHLTAAEYASNVYEAPIDGKQYARKDGAWVEVVGGSGTGMATFDTTLDFARGNMVATATITDATMTGTKIIQAFYQDALDEVAVLNMRVNERSRTDGVGFELIGVAPNGAFGVYNVRCIVSGS